MLEETVI